ncbi:hypothetical protein CGCVW01_v010805 [Colletotrichum viniferum]|nr:hypothetical protein CGCVW01_v010805 [Colletotrichum viniferum]
MAWFSWLASSSSGEIFFIQSPGLHTPSRWPGLMDRLHKVAISISSGYALYRTSYPAGKALESPALAEFFQGKREWTSLQIGPGAHFFIGLSPTEFSWGLTHRDEDSAVEDWNRVVDSRGAL